MASYNQLPPGFDFLQCTQPLWVIGGAVVSLCLAKWVFRHISSILRNL